jgi:hypothetical protein
MYKPKQITIMKNKYIIVDMLTFMHIGKMDELQWDILCDICKESNIHETQCAFINGAYARLIIQ